MVIRRKYRNSWYIKTILTSKRVYIRNEKIAVKLVGNCLKHTKKDILQMKIQIYELNVM